MRRASHEGEGSTRPKRRELLQQGLRALRCGERRQFRHNPIANVLSRSHAVEQCAERGGDRGLGVVDRSEPGREQRRVGETGDDVREDGGA